MADEQLLNEENIDYRKKFEDIMKIETAKEFLDIAKENISNNKYTIEGLVSQCIYQNKLIAELHGKISNLESSINLWKDKSKADSLMIEDLESQLEFAKNAKTEAESRCEVILSSIESERDNLKKELRKLKTELNSKQFE